MAKELPDAGLDIEAARKKMLECFERFSGEAVGDLTWAEMDKKFNVPKRCSDSTGKLQLYVDLKNKGWKDGAKEESD